MATDKQERRGFDPRSVLTGHGPGQMRCWFRLGDSVYEQGDPGDAIFFVENGWIKMTSVSGDGREAVLALRGPGEFLGSRCLLDLSRASTATALTDCSVVRVTKPMLTSLLRNVPDFAEMFATYLVRQSVEDQELLVDQLTNSAERRLARALLRLAVSGSGGDAAPIPARINQTLLAEMVGTTRSRVNFFMNKFKRERLIEYNRVGDINVRNTLSRVLAER